MTEKIATEALYFNEDRTRLVKEGDPDARSLAAAPGDPIPEVEKPDQAAKAAEKPTDKAVKAADNK